MANDINSADFNVPSSMSNGTPIALTASYQTIHTVPSGRMDEVYIWGHNPTISPININVKFGASGTVIMEHTVPAYSSELILPGIRLQNATANTIQVKGNGAICMCNINTLQA